MSTFNTSMFQSIKDALASSDSKGSATFNEIMPTKVGNTYTVRLLPYAIGEKTMESVKLRINPDNSGGKSLNEEYCGDCLREEEVISKSLDTLIGKTRRSDKSD